MEDGSRRLDTCPQVAGVAALIHGAQTVQINGGDFIIQNQQNPAAEIHIPFALHHIANFRDIQIATLGKASPNTGNWIYVWREFCIWLDLEGHIRILWGSGMPGAGKTILTSIIINAVEAHVQASKLPICVGFVYIRYNSHVKATVRGFLKVLVKQTIERHPHCLPIFNEVHDRHMRENTEPSEQEFLDLLGRFTQLMAATFYFIEALDEAPPEIQFDLIEKLSSLNVKLFITSRPLKTLEARFPDSHCFHCFSVVARDCDLDLHIAKEVSRSAELCALLDEAGETWRERVRSSIKKKCGGMFLHATLQLDSLRECTNLYDVERTLEDFPPQIEGFYHQTWSRIMHQDFRKLLLVKRVLLWVLNTTRSLTIEELRYAVATCPDSHHFDPNRLVPGVALITLCGGLVVIEEETHLVRLVHSTARNTLESRILDTFPHPHSHLAAVCMNRLVDRGFQRTPFGSDHELEAGLTAEPFLVYAYEYWLTHARKAQGEMSSTSRLEEFIRGCNAFPISFFFPNSGPLFDVLSPLHVVAYFNLPLSYAGSHYSEDPNPRTRYLGATPLCLTPWRNSKKTLQELLGLPNILVNTADRYGNTALIWASKIGLGGVVKLLLDHSKIKINQVDQRGWAALLWASRHGHEQVVRLLLSNPKVKVNQSDPTGMTALIRASLLGHEGVVRLLLSRSDIKVNQTELAGGSTALIQASEHGREGVIKLLLSHPKTNVNVTDREGRSALIWAICATSIFGLSDDNRNETVKLILSHPRVDISIVDKEGRSAHQWATQEGRLDIIELLHAHYELTTPATVGSSCGTNRGHGRVSQALDALARRAFPFGRKH